MSTSETQTNEGSRLESLWAGDFGKDYTTRNQGQYDKRSAFWNEFLEKYGPERVLEVGCNLGGNLQWISKQNEPSDTYGIDINPTAINKLRETIPSINAIVGKGRELPFRDQYFDLVFTAGVLIHQPEATLKEVMGEIVRCSRKYILCLEYFSEETVEIPYRGQSGALFKRNYGKIYQDTFPELKEIQTGELGTDEGWDQVTYWLFEK